MTFPRRLLPLKLFGFVGTRNTRMVVPEDLKSLASILADWAAPAPRISVHLFGSRVRGDHNPDADVRSALAQRRQT
jgi:Nucleotidyltransferase domain